MKRYYLILIPVSLIFFPFLIFVLYSKRPSVDGQGGLSQTATSSTPSALCPDCNVILISVDSLRADHIGAYGYARDTTPNFDALTKEGYLFLNYFSTSFLTPVSEMSVHTGLYPSASGVTNFDTELPAKATTLAEYLTDKGYVSSALVSSPEFLFNPALKASFSRGFASGFYWGTDATILSATGRRRPPTTETVHTELKGLKDKRFFLWMPLGLVHSPYGGLNVKKVPNVFADSAYVGPLKDSYLDQDTFEHIYNGVLYPEKKALTKQDTHYIVDNYDNGIRAFDTFLGKFVKELAAEGLSDNTIIVIQSEHGEDLGEHGYFTHYDVYDTQVHVPLYIYVPGAPKNIKVHSLASGVDVMPTIIDLLGYEVPSELEGKSLGSLISGAEKEGQRNEVFIERNPLWEEASLAIKENLESEGFKVMSGIYKDIAVRTARWKYISRLSRERLMQISMWSKLIGAPVVIPDGELYDLASDPSEQRNVAKEHPDVVDDLSALLAAWTRNISASGVPDVKFVPTIQPYF